MTLSLHSTPRLNTLLFITSCVAIYAASALLAPRAFPLLGLDSPGYIEFASSRTAIYPIFLRALSALGLGLEQITYVQLVLFVLALMVLIAALLRAQVCRAFGPSFLSSALSSVSTFRPSIGQS